MIKNPTRDQLKRRAGFLIGAAVRKGTMPAARALMCADCGRPAQQYDHRDYAKPLEVVAVCIRCNHQRGPGLPPIDLQTDRLTVKTDFKQKNGENTGKSWSATEGDAEGYSPLNCVVVDNESVTRAIRNAEAHSHVDGNSQEYDKHMDVKTSWRDRFRYFAIHDPWY